METEGAVLGRGDRDPVHCSSGSDDLILVLNARGIHHHLAYDASVIGLHHLHRRNRPPGGADGARHLGGEAGQAVRHLKAEGDAVLR